MSEAKALRNSALQPRSHNAPWPTLDLCTNERTSVRVHTAWIKMDFIRSQSICYTVFWWRCAMWKGVKKRQKWSCCHSSTGKELWFCFYPQLWSTKKEPLLKYKLPSSPNNRITFERADDHFNPSNSDELECLSHTFCQHVILQWFRGQQPDHCIYNSISFDHQLRPADLHLKFSSSVAMVQVQMPLWGPMSGLCWIFPSKGGCYFCSPLVQFSLFCTKG